MSWQPIETAPRDGTRILVAQPGLAGFIQIVAYDASPRAKARWKVGSRYGRSVQQTPTHWMPLPSPPEQSDEA